MTKSLTFGRRTLVLSTGRHTADRRCMASNPGGPRMRALFGPCGRGCAVLITR